MNKKNLLAVILGSGLGVILDNLKDTEILFEEKSGIHHKLYVKTEVDGFPVLFLSGRKHFYEGHSAEDITSNVRFAFKHGARYLLTTNAAGGLNYNFSVSDLMLFKSYYNMNDKPVSRMNGNVSKILNEILIKTARDNSIKLHQGVYCCASGPSYETPAEIYLLKKMMADAVGMSTIPELIEAKRLGMKASAISVITNLLKENSLEVTDHSSVIKASHNASQSLFKLICLLLKELK